MIIWQVIFNFVFPMTGTWHLTKGDFEPRASVLTVFSPFLGNTVITSARFQGYWPQCHQIKTEWSVKHIALFPSWRVCGFMPNGTKIVLHFNETKQGNFVAHDSTLAFFMLSKFEEGRVVVQKFKLLMNVVRFNCLNSYNFWLLLFYNQVFVHVVISFKQTVLIKLFKIMFVSLQFERV